MTDFKSTIDFIKSVYGNKEFTPLAVPVFAGNEKAYLNECIDTTFVSSVGKFVDRFEIYRCKACRSVREWNQRPPHVAPARRCEEGR